VGLKNKKEEMIFEEITEDILNEKLITYGNRKPYGQIVFIAGGAGSGKGFAISNFIDSASFKVRDVDEMKKQLQILNRLGKLDINSIIKKYGKNIKPKDIDLINKIQDDGFKLQNLNLKNSDHVYALHILVKAIGIKDASLEKLLLGKNNPETLPNILFDITAKDVTDITSVIPKLKAVGYKPENIHLTWVLTKYVTALENNKNRERKVPDGSMGSENIMLKTHEGASNTIWGLVTKALPKGMNGRVDVILNNPENTVFLKGADGKDVEKRQTSSTNKVVKGIDGKQKTIRTTKSKTVKFTSGFLSLPLKKEKGGIYAEKVWRNKLFNWVKSNAPESITANMKESVNEAIEPQIRKIAELTGVSIDKVEKYVSSRVLNITKLLKYIKDEKQVAIRGFDKAVKGDKKQDAYFIKMFNESVNEDKIDVLRKAVQKINRKYKVNVSSHPVTKGEIEIILGSGNHPDSDYHAIEKLVNKLGIKNHSIFNESIDEATFRPNSGTMSGGTYGLDNRKYQLKRDVKGVRIGDYTNVILPKGTIIYNIPGGVFAHHDVLAAYQSGQNKYFNQSTFKGISIRREKNTIMAIEKNSKILESVNGLNLNESVFSAIDLIRQDAKDVRDFVKKVFSDRNFKDMKNDKDFIKYLKSIYEGVSVNEISKFAGWVAIDHKGKRLEIKKSEAKDLYNAKLFAIKKLKVPKSKESMLVIEPGYNESVVNEINTSVNKRRAGAELKQKLKGKRSDGMGKYTATIYGLDSNGKRVELKSLNDLNKYSKFELDESVVNEANLRLNKKVKSELDAYLKGTKINSPEHQHAIMLILKGALTDANFHSEAKQLPKFFPKAKQSKHVGTAMEDVIEDKGAAYSKAAKWDGHDIIDAFSFYTSMTIGGSFGKKLETLKESISESINESLKHNDMYTMLDIAAGYSSTQDQAAGQMWSDEQDLYDYLKSDHIPKKYHKKFHNDIKRRFKNIKESVVNEGKYNYKADALTAYFKGKIDAKELDKIARDDFKSGIATKKELSNFLSNKFTQDVMSDTYGIPAGTLIKRVRGLMKFAEGVSESVVNEGSVANKWNIQSQDIGKLQKKTSFSSETSMPFSLISNLSGGVNSTDKGIVSGHFNKDVVILQFYPKEDSRNDTMYDAVDKKGIIAIDKLMKKQYGLSMVSPFLLKGKRHCSADGEVCSVSNYLVFGGTNESIEERVNLFLEKNVPTDASKWSYYKSQAKKKFDVYPSAYANGWAAKKYKAAGGGWKTEK